MKTLVLIAVLLIGLNCNAQTPKQAPPSYFGIMVRPVFPTNFLGPKETQLVSNGYEATLTQTVGYGFGGTVRIGLTKLIAIETGINFTERNYDVAMSVVDSNAYSNNRMTFIEYDIPVNGLMYIQLADQWFMNASIGFSLSWRPTDVGIFDAPGGLNTFTHYGIPDSKLGIGANANVGFEFRTKEKGFFYLGGSARVPFGPLFYAVGQYQWEGIRWQDVEEVDGSFMSIDFKYFFPNIKNKGPQFQNGPIE